jgi:uncharacterized membrane protein YhaH (DUF805 family)
MPSTNPLALLFSPSGRLDQRTFGYAVVAFYAVGLASQFLLSTPVTVRVGLWPYALAQIVLTWIWFALHAKRMRDVGRGIGGVLTIAILYVVPVVLLVAFLAVTAGSSTDQSHSGAASGLGLLFAVFFIYVLTVDPSKFVLLLVAFIILVLFTYVPLLLALIWSIRAGTRPSAPPP